MLNMTANVGQRKLNLFLIQGIILIYETFRCDSSLVKI